MNPKESLIMPKFKELIEKNSSIRNDTIYTDNIINTTDKTKINNNPNVTLNIDRNIDINKKEKEDDNYWMKRIEDDKIEIEEDSEKENKNIIFINSTPGKIQFLIKKAQMKSHYYKNINGEIYSYRRKSILNRDPLVYYCNRDKIHCRGKLRIYNDFATLKFDGFHNHDEGIEKTIFYKRYPFLHKEIWRHIQIFEMGKKVLVVRLS